MSIIQISIHRFRCGPGSRHPAIVHFAAVLLLTLLIGEAAETRPNQIPQVTVDVPKVVLPVRTDVGFSAAATDPDGDPVTISWNFGDGGTEASGSSVTHRFVQGGAHTIICSARDTHGGTARQTFTVNVDDPLASWGRLTISNGSLRAVVAGSPGAVAVGVGVIANAALRQIIRFDQNEFYNDVASHRSQFIAVGGRRDEGSASPSPIIIGIVPAVPPIFHQTHAFSIPVNAATEFTSVAYGGGRYVVVGSSGVMLQSADLGATWLPVITTTTHDFRRVRYSNGRFVAMTLYGTMMASIDGLSWTTTPLDTVLFDLTYHRGMWIAVGPRSAYVSPDGARWEQRALPSESIACCQSLGDVLLASDQGERRIFISEDGIKWFSVPLVAWEPGDGHITATCVIGNEVVATSSRGALLVTKLTSEAGIPPRLSPKLHDLFVPAGQSFTLVGGVSGASLTYQWQKDGKDIPGATASTMLFPNLQPADGGVYVLKAANYGGAVVTEPVTLQAEENTARLINLSVLARVGRDAETLTVGVVTSRAPFTTRSPYATPPHRGKELVFRAVGPALEQFGVAGALADPRLDVFAGNVRLGGNDDWGAADIDRWADVFDHVGAFRLPMDSKDAAYFGVFSLGINTIEVTSADMTAGMVLAEVYDVDRTLDIGRLVNLSARSRLAAGTDTLMAGFTIAGAGRCTLFIRAVGPTLSAFGLSAAARDPKIEVISGTSVIAYNDDWSNDVAIVNAAVQTGAFPLAASSKDAAVIVALLAGSYTARVSDAAGSGGTALVEIYELR